MRPGSQVPVDLRIGDPYSIALENLRPFLSPIAALSSATKSSSISSARPLAKILRTT